MPVISTISIKGGSQKTTTTLCLGLTLAKRGYKTVLIDMDASNESLSSWKTNRQAIGKEMPENLDVITYEEMERVLKKSDFMDFLDSLQAQLAQEDFVIIDVEGTANETMVDAILKSNILLAPFAMSQLDADGAKKTYQQVLRQQKIVDREIDCRLVPTKTPKLLATMPNADRQMISDILFDLENIGIKAFDSSLADRTAYRHLFNKNHAYTLDELPDEGVDNKANALLECEYLVEDVLDAMLDGEVKISKDRVTLGSVIRSYRKKHGLEQTKVE